MLSLHEVKIHKVYNFLYIYAIFIISFTFMQLWVQEIVASCNMVSLEDESRARQHKEKIFQKQGRSDILLKHQQNDTHIN